MPKTAYVVEDDENIRDLITAALGTAGFGVEGFESGEELYPALSRALPSIVLLDIMLPGESGLDILRKLRQTPRWQELPVIFLTAKSRELDKVAGLELGADDYIPKPFGVLELLARVNAVLRRYGKAASPTGEMVFRYRDLLLDTPSKTVFQAGEALTLTAKEYELLLYLYKNRGIVLSREQLLLEIWNYDYGGETRTVDSHIRSLRRKLGDSAEQPRYIVTIRGYGYKLLKEDL